MAPISRSRENIILFLFGILGIIFFIFLYPRVQPASQMDISINRQEALQIGEAHLAKLVVTKNSSSYSTRKITFAANNRHKNYLKSINATPTERATLLTHSAPYYWNVTFEDPEDRSRYQFKVASDGTVFENIYSPPLDMVGEQLLPRQAERAARKTLEELLDVQWSSYSRIDANTVDLDTRTDHTFTWRTNNPVAGEARLRINATVMGDKVKSWSKTVEFPREFEELYEARLTQYNLISVSQLILVIILWVIALFVFAFRFRSNEVSIRNGLIVALIMLITLLIFWSDTFHYLETIGPVSETESHLTRIALYINIGFQIFFTCFCLFFVWMAGESISRDLWPRKLKATDGLIAQRFFFPDLGRAILRGFSLGFGCLGLSFLVSAVLHELPYVWPVVSPSEQQILSSQSSSLFFFSVAPLTYAMQGSLLSATYAILFLFSYTQNRSRRFFSAFALSWLVFYFLSWETVLAYPQWLSILPGLIPSLILFYAFIRYDLLTVILGIFITTFLPHTFLYLHQADSLLSITGIGGLIVVASVFAYGLAARIRGKVLDDIAIEPAYARNITERQRMKLELDFARRAQLKMLPQSLPDKKGLDIAAFSEPAREVGGDYFDFFHLSNDTLGFAVGDVSGKGISAALYMTMLKGSLQSQAHLNTSPKDLLSHTNRTFFKSAERTTFVTLLYGVIDLKENQLTFARAGHNPVVIYRPQTEVLFFLKPPGMGIGLEQGVIFDRVLEQETFSLQRGDTIIVYTDGLTEARNIRNEEFGEDRLTKIIKSRPVSTAEELITRIKNGYFSFTGRADAHDDLTCMVIRMQ